MRRTGLQEITAIFLLVFYGTIAQAQLWTTDFEGTNANVTLNTTDLGSVGAAGSNVWIINADYAGGTVGPITVPPTPPQPAAIVPNGQNYLHITSVAGQAVIPPIQNAHFDTTAPAGESYFVEIATGVNTVGQTNVTLSFWFLNGSPATRAEVYVKDGAAGVWSLLPDADFSNSLGGIVNWVQTTYSGTLLDNRNNIFIGLRFIASTPATMPSFSVDNMEINAPPAVTANVQAPIPLPTVFCSGDTVTFKALTDPNIVSYQWNFNGANTGPQAIVAPNAFFTAGTPGNYQFQLIVSDGLIQDDTIWNVTINPCNDPTIIIAGTPRNVCVGTQVTFSDNTVAGSTPLTGRQWTFPGGTPATSTAQNPTVTYNGPPGVYDVYFFVTDANGVHRDTLFNYITVQGCPPPIADFTASTRTLCPGDCISFTDQSLNMTGSSQWLWQFPGADSSTSGIQNPQNICYQTPGLYDVTLTATNVNGSDQETKVGFIRVDSCLGPEARFTVEKDSICRGTCVQFFSQALRADSFSWTFNGADAPYVTSILQNPIACYSDSGLFDVTLIVTNEFGLDISQPSTISVKGYPEVEAGLDETILIGNSVRLEAFGTTSNFRWTPDYEIEGANERTPVVSPKENTIYYVTNTNDHGCTATDSLRVTVRNEYFAGVPDIFSPNDDFVNDFLFVRGNGITELEFYVYNRLGEQVFQSRNQSVGWDGTFRGEKLNPGVFVYFAKITYLNGFQEILQGDVTLVR